MIIKGTTIEIPDSLIVRGDLDLWNTTVTELPAGLTVGGWLDLRATKITTLPVDLTVGGCVYAYDGQLIASEAVQLYWIEKGADMLQVFKKPTEKANRLHEMLWEL